MPFVFSWGSWIPAALFGFFFGVGLVTGHIPRNGGSISRKNDPDLFWCVIAGLGLAFVVLLILSIQTTFFAGS